MDDGGCCERAAQVAALQEQVDALSARVTELSRLATIGRLAAGIGHEVNNPLAFVIANLEYAAETLGEARIRSLGEVEVAIAETRDGVERIARIVRDLHTLARQPADADQVDLEELLAAAVKLTSSQTRNRADVTCHAKGVPRVAGDPTRLTQVFVNLLVNAAHAIDRGQGHITIEATPRAADVEVLVHDSGAGIPPDVLGKVFDPFFTTKAAGQGTGLGLALCRDIVEEVGGSIDIHSKVGEGTTVRVLLPVAVPRRATSTLPAPSSIAPAARPRVLVVDDEPTVCRAVRRMLKRTFDVTATTRAREALEWLKDGARYDVVLCDIMMPDLSGAAFVRELERVAPEQLGSLLVMTGGPFSDEGRALQKAMGERCLTKPFEAATVTAAVHEIMGHRTAA